MKRKIRRFRVISLVMCFMCLMANPVFALNPVQGTIYVGPIEVEPLFEMPTMIYEGHETILRDNSIYVLSSGRKSAPEAYELKVAKVEFVPSDEDNIVIRKVSGKDNERRAVFNKVGRFGVTMVLKTNDGEVYEVKKYINVNKTPETESVMSGAQKQDRLQVIEFKTAVNPEYPLNRISFEIKNADSGEAVSCEIDGGGIKAGEMNLENSENIKARPLKLDVSEDGCYVYGRVEFVARYTRAANLVYRIESADVRGNKHVFDEKFTVNPDEAPTAEFKMQEKFVRDEGSDYAVIELEDVSVADGEQLLHKWMIKYDGETEFGDVSAEEGYADASSGNGNRVSFRKKGVGKFTVRMRVTDSWSDGTIDEFTADKVILSDECEMSGEVVNIAPRVSLGVSESKVADIVMIHDVGNDTVPEGDFEELRVNLLEKGIDAGLSEEKIKYSGISQDGTDVLSETMSISSPFGYNGGSTAFEQNLYIVDNFNLYTVDAVWNNPDSSGRPEEPYTISAYDASDGSVVWQFPLTSDTFNLDYTSSATHLYQDDSAKYLYLVSGGKTLIMSKKNGQVVSVVSGAVGEYNFCGRGSILTFKSDGIYSVSMQNGAVKRIYGASLSGVARRIGGKAVTYEMSSVGSVSKLMLDLENETVEKEYTGKFYDSELCPSGYKYYGQRPVLETTGIDSAGNAVLTCNSCLLNITGGSSRYYKTVVKVFDANGKFLKSADRSSGYAMKAVAVTDKSGKSNYFALSCDGNDTVTMCVYGIYSDYSKSCTLSDSNGEPTVYQNIIYAYEMSGNVYITTGAYCVWIYNGTWGNGPAHGYPERCVTFSFNPITGSAAKYSGYLPGCYGFSEYGNSSDFYTAVHTGKNCQYIGLAILENKVSVKAHNLYDVLFRAFNKSINKENHAYKSVLIYGDGLSGTLTENERTMLRKMLDENSCSLHVLGKSGGNASKIASLLGADYIETGGKYADVLMEAVTSHENEAEEKYTEIKPEEDVSGNMSKTYSLEKDTKYYYELEVAAAQKPADVVSVDNNTKNILAESTYTDKSLYIKRTEMESFNGAEPENKFFKYSTYAASGGTYTPCRIYRSSSGNVYLDSSATITFKIPEGEKGILSFDYQFLRKQSYINGNYFEIDGARWSAAEKASQQLFEEGSYVHSEILGSGTHTLYMFTGSYGSKMEAYTYLKMLKVDIVTEESQQNGNILEKITQISKDRFAVSGEFTTPGDASQYREMKGIQYVSGPVGSGTYSKYVDAENDNMKSVSMDIPTGKKAIATRIRTSSYCGSTYVVYYYWDTGGMSWPCRMYHSTIQSTLSYVNSSWIMNLPVFSGKQSFSMQFSAYRGTSANFSNIEMYLGENSNKLTESGKYIKAVGTNGKSLFLPENEYGEKSSVSINLGQNISRIYKFSIYRMENGQKIYLDVNNFSDDSTLGKWEVSGAQTGVSSGKAEGEYEEDIKVFAKGELVNFDIQYSDYEADPSKKSYWKYTHTPLNDGANENAAVILDGRGNVCEERDIVLSEPIQRFYIDGMYTVEHWQEDDTSRGSAEEGNPDYDKKSNVVSITFYISGQMEAPWVQYIRTNPEDVNEGGAFGLKIGVDDEKKDVLSLKTDVYTADRLIFSAYRDGIEADNEGNYPVIEISRVTAAAVSGKYKVICTVRDEAGASMAVYDFYVLTSGKIDGMVTHTDEWEKNRKSYNMHYYGEEFNEISEISGYTQKCGRMANVFWPGERMVLTAVVEGSPRQVYAYMEGYEDCRCTLERNGEVYGGALWNRDMYEKLNIGKAIGINVIFIADYGNGTEKVSSAQIIVDPEDLYWKIHRMG